MKNTLFLVLTLAIFFAGCASIPKSPDETNHGRVLAPKCPTANDKVKQQSLCYGKDEKNGLKEGLWCCYDVLQRLLMAGEFKNGVKDGRAELYSPTGDYQAISYWKQGFLDGPQVSFNPQGGIDVEYMMKGAVLDGVLREFYPNGKLRSVGYYKDGFRNGMYQEYDEKGCLIREEKDEMGTNIYSHEMKDCH